MTHSGSNNNDDDDDDDDNHIDNVFKEQPQRNATHQQNVKQTENGP